MKELFKTIEHNQSAAVLLAIVFLCVLSYLKGFIKEALKHKKREYWAYILRRYELEWIPITEIPDHDCDVLFKNNHNKGMSRYYTGRWDKENGFWSTSGYCDQTHYQIINK